MNSQCNGSFLPKWQETRAGTDALPYTVCFCCPVFWGQAPLSPQDAHVGPRWANWYPREFYDPGAYRNVRQTCVFRQKPKI
jgi:hypothetical protein